MHDARLDNLAARQEKGVVQQYAPPARGPTAREAQNWFSKWVAQLADKFIGIRLAGNYPLKSLASHNGT